MHFLSWQSERENGRVAAHLMLSRLNAALDHTYMHIFSYFLGMEESKLIK